MNCPHAKPGYPPCTTCVRTRDRGVDIILHDIGSAGYLVCRLARCDHSAAVTVHGTAEWCASCGSVRALGSAGWLEPGAWVLAKELDEAAPLRGTPAEALVDPNGPKIRN